MQNLETTIVLKMSEFKINFETPGAQIVLEKNMSK